MLQIQKKRSGKTVLFFENQEPLPWKEGKHGKAKIDWRVIAARSCR
jgi:hypothetical protein